MTVSRSAAGYSVSPKRLNLVNGDRQMANRRYSDEEILQSLKAAAVHLKHSPRASEYQELFSAGSVLGVCVSRTTIRRRFNNMWNRALQAAGLEPLEEVSLLTIAKCLIAAARLSRRSPNTVEYDELYRTPANGIFISHQTIIQWMGSWRQALAFVGLPPGDTCRVSRFTYTARPERTTNEKRACSRMKVMLQQLSAPKFDDERALKILLLLHEAEEATASLIASPPRSLDRENSADQLQEIHRQIREVALDLVE